jgi:hypothetical protein
VDHPLPTSWYVSRRVELPFAQAAAALDELVDQRRRDGRVPTHLTPTLIAEPAAPRLGSSRELHGRLRLPRSVPPVRVELELVAWSASQSELGIRPVRTPVARATRYWKTAAATLDRLRGELITVADPAVEPALRRAS